MQFYQTISKHLSAQQLEIQDFWLTQNTLLKWRIHDYKGEKEHKKREEKKKFCHSGGIIGASVSEPPLNAAKGDFVGAYIQMHGPIYRKYFKYLFQRHALAHARPTMLCIH